MQPPQVALHADGLFVALDTPSRGPPCGVQPRARVPSDERRGRQPLGLRTGVGPAFPLAEALGRAALLRAREGLQARIREAVRLAELFESWVREEPGWELCAPRP